MDKGAKEANEEIRFNKVISKLDRIIYLLELLTNKGYNKFRGK